MRKARLVKASRRQAQQESRTTWAPLPLPRAGEVPAEPPPREPLLPRRKCLALELAEGYKRQRMAGDVEVAARTLAQLVKLASRGEESDA